MLAMTQDVLDALSAVSEISGVILVCRDPAAAELDTSQKVEIFSSPFDHDLNSALESALAVLADRKVATAIILPGDLPLVSVADIETILQAHRPECALTIVEDQDSDGTNCLIVSPPDGVAMSFGPGSFEKHKISAVDAGLKLNVAARSDHWLDIDRPEDFERFRQYVADRAISGHTAIFIRNFSS